MVKANKEKQRKVPILRFKDFTNDWEQRKLETLSEHKGGTSIEKYFSSNGLYKVISIGSYGLNNEYIDQGIRAEKNKITESKLVRSGQLTMVLNDKTANGNLIGRCLLIDKDNEFVVNQRTEIIIPGPDLNENYTYYYLNGPFRNKIKRIAQGGTQIYVNYSSVKKQKINYPSKEEQIKISQLQGVIKNLITLYERKVKLLLQIKKYLLDNLFTEKDYPKLRFKGFTEAWEQRQLNEITTRVLRKNKNLISKRPLTISAQYGLIDQQAFFNKQVASSNLENYLLLEKGEFAYNKSYSDGFPYGTIKKLNLYDNGAVSTLYIAFKANADINSDFLENLFSSNKWHNEVYKIAAEGARNHGLLNISPDDFFNIKITISKDSQEQAFISKFLRIFDNLLALYENKQKQLTQIKNNLLNTMFI